MNDYSMNEVIALEGELHPIAGYPGAYVAPSGHIYAYRRWRGQMRECLYRLTVYMRTGNTPSVQFPNRQHRHQVLFVHHVVAAAYLPPPPYAGARPGFRDGNPANCAADNLYWKVNEPRMRVIERRAAGFIGKAHKLRSVDLEAIRARLAVGDVQAQIARDYGVTEGMITRIKNGERHS